MTTLTLDSKLLIETLLGKDTTPEIVDMLRTKLRLIVLPWRPDGCMPPKFERVTALGDRVALVDGWLGGYGQPHEPRHHGWGYSGGVSALGYGGTCVRGVVKVELPGGQILTEKAIKQAEHAAMLSAMKIVDDFIRKERPGTILLDEPLKEPK